VCGKLICLRPASPVFPNGIEDTKRHPKNLRLFSLPCAFSSSERRRTYFSRRDKPSPQQCQHSADDIFSSREKTSSSRAALSSVHHTFAAAGKACGKAWRGGACVSREIRSGRRRRKNESARPSPPTSLGARHLTSSTLSTAAPHLCKLIPNFALLYSTCGTRNQCLYTHVRSPLCLFLLIGS